MTAKKIFLAITIALAFAAQSFAAVQFKAALAENPTAADFFLGQDDSQAAVGYYTGTEILGWLNTVYPSKLTALTGGAAGALDSLGVATLTDGDIQIVRTISGTTVTVYVYVFDADGTSAESSPTTIRPDDYTTQGVWRLALASNQNLLNNANPAFNTVNLTGGKLATGNGGSVDGGLQVKNATNTNIFTVQPGVTAADISWTLPTAAPGGANYLLDVDVDGTMGYTDPATLGGDDLGSAAYTDVVALWTTCTGYLKNDGTCDAGTGLADLDALPGDTVDDDLIDSAILGPVATLDIANGGKLRTATTTSGHAWCLQAYDNDGAAYADLVCLTNGNEPTATFPALGLTSLVFEGTADDYETTISVTDPTTSDRTFTIGDYDAQTVAAGDVNAAGHVDIVYDSDGAGAVQFTGLSATRAKTISDAADTIVEAGATNSFTGTNTLGDHGDDIKVALNVNAGDGTWSGLTILRTVATGSAGEAFGQVMFVESDGELAAADADATTSMPGVCILVVSGEGASKTCLINGTVTETDWNWTVGGLVYVSTDPTTTTGLTQTAPSGSGDQVQVVGVALSADTLLVQPSLVLVAVP